MDILKLLPVAIIIILQHKIIVQKVLVQIGKNILTLCPLAGNRLLLMV